MAQFLNICEYFEITPMQFFDGETLYPATRRGYAAAIWNYRKGSEHMANEKDQLTPEELPFDLKNEIGEIDKVQRFSRRV